MHKSAIFVQKCAQTINSQHKNMYPRNTFANCYINLNESLSSLSLLLLLMQNIGSRLLLEICIGIATAIQTLTLL